MLTERKGNEDSIWGSPSPTPSLPPWRAPASPNRGNNEGEERLGEPSGLIGLSVEDAKLVATYLAPTPVAEVVGTCGHCSHLSLTPRYSLWYQRTQYSLIQSPWAPSTAGFWMP